MDNKIVSNLFGIAGAILWSIQLVPQSKKSADNLSPLCFLSWYICGIFLGTYLLFERDTIALIIQIFAFTFFCLALLFQIMHYQKKKPLMSLASIFIAAIILSVVRNAMKYENFKDDIEMSDTTTGAKGDADNKEDNEDSEKAALNTQYNTFADPALFKPLSSSNDKNELNEMAKPNITTSLIRSSYIISHSAQVQEFDHIVPDSESDSEEATLKQNIILNQTSSLFGRAVN
ncbi:hypothetical protein PPL_07338 [Heterostelium album PN500]|uniref:Uncharacterized protein n=1 Tax=Heterostelium pallidum (strain ATCC 26659 / Pp 5 / PN500) TaxID=670386 RepID=D3BF21_HETP5|nr:hypothetical protein PPL_07338 [Heterostelium album PN500]EFA80502.1 hypothetical protein PPL_07338 [Heterostelium album PN500]|eukprot:XP_020432622.1 hypothetical protein PPL_07338 [Heterostelium album PN500]